MAKSFAPGSTLLTTFSKRLRSQMTNPQSGATRILNKRAISTTAAVGGAGSMLTSSTSTRVVTACQGPSRSQAQSGTAASTKIGRQCTARRGFTSSSKVGYKTVEEQRSRYRSGPFSWKGGLLFLISGVGLAFYFRYEKSRMERKRITEATKGVGKPQVGGPFNLLDQDGKPFSGEDLKGKYALVYFGFTHCPDICPEELDKMSIAIDLVNAKSPSALRPVFITCDPARDTPAVLKTYLSEFHPSLIGLTGTWEQIKAVCKAYRVYFSTPPDVKPGQDYLVDHSIYFYLMDPDGDFVEAIGRQHSPQKAAEIVLNHMGDWKGKLDRT